MKISLIRTDYTENETRGIMSVGKTHIGYTLEPPTFGHTSQNGLFALPPGEYEMHFRHNPIAGVPCIKIDGITYSATATIRSCKPKGKNNASITLMSNPNGRGEASEMDFDAWIALINIINNNRTTTLIIK